MKHPELKGIHPILPEIKRRADDRDQGDNEQKDGIAPIHPIKRYSRNHLGGSCVVKGCLALSSIQRITEFASAKPGLILIGGLLLTVIRPPIQHPSAIFAVQVISFSAFTETTVDLITFI